ncbi:HK97 family phage prohead protease [Mesorhizobium sp. M4B.F.Ca.ET.013.02.1.1]|uniref:HK97 family phage prohead protease n=1 Tax=Mesorhizobium sp. M4B.F.Ca.ET.013.02.1.1 TaxID=2496755 RepID=UPI000FD5BDD9|nr:HK97 family phage prohead protease [Mesorhizobium sp. M4B.F.Ca.ET.013.02.1.1]RUW17386.1 HK97 family phage prohead protease [Mesorhizobium sp. M4B.F.Ca.ET.013.02.1.1]
MITGYVSRFTGPVTRFDEQKFAGNADRTTLATIAGYATKYWNLHVYKGGIDVFTDTCFDESVVFGRDIRFLVNHDWDKNVGGTNDGLELMSDQDGLSFRYPLPDTPLGREALKMIDDGKGQAGMSVGYRIVKNQFVTIDGQKVQALTKCQLNEISIVKVGAVPGAFTHVQTEPGDDLKLACDAAALKMRWALHDFGKAMEKLGQRSLGE